MDISWFKNLNHLAQTGNFSSAAVKGNISQPAFSRRIKALEQWVGTPLVNRRKHPISLTFAGEQMLEAALQAFERLDYEKSQIQAAQTRPDKYIVTFGTQHSIGWRFYPTWLQALEDNYGDLISQLRSDDLINCIDALNNSEIDFVIAYQSAHDSLESTMTNAQSIIIGADRLVPVCKPDNFGKPLFSFKNPLSPPVPWLRFGQTAWISRHIEPVMRQYNIHSRLSVIYENSMAGALRTRAKDGQGVAWLPKSLVKPDIDAGFLVPTGPDNWQIELDICLYRDRMHTNELTRDLWAFLSNRQNTSIMRKIAKP